ncbi:MAG TPA: acyl transferase [Bacteroidia bacterium]|nr:acyl transferase [Bacteroidia bacterium]
MLASACFDIRTDSDFNNHALSVFAFQVKNVAVYREYLEALNFDVDSVHHYSQIPFLPVSFFKTRSVIADGFHSQINFTSSGTTGMITSTHPVADVKLYEQSFNRAFELFYGPVHNYCVIALLPAYLEREGSSLVYMADHLIKHSKHPQSGFYLNQYHELANLLNELSGRKQKTILLGVTFALLDICEKYNFNFPELIVMETGGMKGRRKEMIREELHDVLCAGFGVKKIHSEYGMTELLSQAYSKGDGIFITPPWMKILLREVNDPFAGVGSNATGGVNVIDLANYYSCAFIATQDLGKQYEDGSFEILGRFDHSDLRGCNLLVQ